MAGAPLQRILLLEDEPDIRSIATHALTVLGGFQVLTCASGREALDFASTFCPQLFLFDVMLPVMDGLATLEAVRRVPALAQTPVVFMTTRTQAIDQVRYRNLGALGFIAKPFDPTTLPQQLHALWSESQPQETTAPHVLGEHLRKLATNYAAQLPSRLQRLQQLIDAAATDIVVLPEAVREAHGLAGGGGIFGFAAVSENLADVEAALLAVREPAELNAKLRQRLSDLMQRALESTRR